MNDIARMPTAEEAFKVYREIEPRASKRDFEAGYRNGKRFTADFVRAEERAARASLVEVLRELAHVTHHHLAIEALKGLGLTDTDIWGSPAGRAARALAGASTAVEREEQE